MTLEVAVKLDMEDIALLQVGLAHLSGFDVEHLDLKLEAARDALLTATQKGIAGA